MKFSPLVMFNIRKIYNLPKKSADVLKSFEQEVKNVFPL